MTHAYFCFYHALSNVVLRRTTHAVQSLHPFIQWLVLAFVVFVLAYITALMETVTIAHFPYYKFKVATALLHARVTSMTPLTISHSHTFVWQILCRSIFIISLLSYVLAC